MTEFDTTTMGMLEDIFGMASGHVLDFSNSTFAAFIQTSVGFDPYTRYEGSKAVILRQIWREESPDVVAKLNKDLLARWKLGKLRRIEELTPYEQHVLEVATEVFSTTESSSTSLSADDIRFLERDLGAVDLGQLPTALSARDIVQGRLDEIDRALSAEAPLAVIFLVGSTLEGLLSELALAQADTFTASPSAPRRDGSVKPVDQWTLSELIAVSRALGVLSEDVARHADQVRNFRNYIHPRQQLRENFEPRMETARIAQQVLRAALLDLNHIATSS